MRKLWQRKLMRVLSDMRNGTRPKSLSVPTIMEIVGAPNTEDLASYVGKLVESGQVRVLYRVNSPETKNTVAEFNLLYEVPSRVFDDTNDTYFRVKPSRDVEIVYSVSES
ncbi:hypothetical protein PhaeoP83_00051 [Phaeobacter inhibens]|uniref:WYL domain-containing protein n=1 Tax=Phaeobacter inhibens TaxID=221822 RepID=A0ABM6R912_9RHOB|nr:hypothetical protein PhaeoP83_00051 [Phaeobacter inhibens]AUQ92875.1 hypothetical protein PhaeoP66_00044 [Phaeobacter inhibens]AUR18178.1 hypothetical protein PhaeoP80_00051 [Phaeobacter inhibens]